MMQIFGAGKYSKYAAFVLVFIAVFTLSIWLKLSGQSSSREVVRNTCPAYDKNQPELNKCHIDRTYELVKKNGIKVALAYVSGVVIKETNYSTTHQVMHLVGREAYYKTKDLGKAFAYLPANAFSAPELIYYDGYQHGILQAFFLEQKNTPVSELIEKACPENVVMPDLNYYQEDRGDNCFHGIGHALMFMSHNDVYASLQYCEALPHLIKQHWCYIGVFMEDSYLYSPLYDPLAPKPFVTDDAMVSLCASVKEEQQGECANYVGRAYWAAHYGDVKGAIDQCFLVARPYRKACVYRLAHFSLPAFFRTDYQSMIDVCKESGQEYEESCILAAADGILRGATGYGSTKEAFCDLLEGELQRKCMAIRL